MAKNIKQKVQALKEWMVENKVPKHNPKGKYDIIAKGITRKYK